MVKVVYFAWVRERIGKGEEELEIPAEVKTAGELVSWLATLGEGYEEALRFPKAIRVAVNQEHVEHNELIAGAREIGIFPPMTGG
ncbi:MAG: molybdopterin converting factor subunit 1 [Rhizobium sp.]|jgi:molybdopterin synthase sulfur carrier subunit|uniref:molybdopterin converting factor subunit 1 n=1 Tax=Agrobacterium sp. MA01 TaxID=2664893 RepID=UPI00129B9D71|nr:molybdopterin converting factor subunit 1 [Agrobacterium sp. MA01]MDM7981262.1 molybdopterin converting factor subunit 1 [Rhizobium sp.]MDM8015042.1 molybdopterin converting factor subunit 1 [Rhizobium sp.]QGG90044.1 molybdopterin converting factor subunit 1 [Agrobacterium sp. MA01]